MTGDDKHVAQSNSVCAKCMKMIKVGKPYVWRRVKMGSSTRLEKIHPECKEQ